jgi:4-diphosphocytidyl-2-C-methyl-D-erythritol kinase
MTVWPAPAKLNLFLHVVGRRADGYHLLQTVFQFLDVADELRFEVTDDARLQREYRLPGVSETQDLILRAARLLQETSGTRKGARIYLTKRLPAGGGLGGGSSDAATVLIALNSLWNLNIPRETLAALGLTLGADVPVFVRGQAAWAEGVGEILTPVELPEPWYAVLTPPVSVSTREVFESPKLTRSTPFITIRAFREGAGANDLEPVVRAIVPEVDSAIKYLGRFGRARMSGSGSSVFVSCASKDEAAKILEGAPCAGFVARGVNRHPLYDGNFKF